MCACRHKLTLESHLCERSPSSQQKIVLEHILLAQLTPWGSSAQDARDSPITCEPQIYQTQPHWTISLQHRLANVSGEQQKPSAGKQNTRAGTWQQQRYHEGTAAVGASAFYSQYITWFLLGTPPGSGTKPCSPVSRGVSWLPLNTKGGNYKIEHEMLSKGSPSHTGQHSVKSQSPCYFMKEKGGTSIAR